MSDQVQTAPIPQTNQRDSKAVASNIVKGITDKANGKGVSSQPPVTEQTKTENQPDPNAGKEKYTVEGKEVWLTPQERTMWIQKGMAFEPRMDQLARLQQEAVQLQRALLNDPGKVIANLAHQAKVPVQTLVERVLAGNSSEEVKESVGKWFYENAVEPLKLTPDQLKAREDAKWRQEREQQDKLSQENAVRAENQAKFQKALNEIKANISEAMKESGLPDNNSPLGVKMARMVADEMRIAHFKREALTPKQAIERVKREIKEVQAAYYNHLDEEALVKEIGESNAEKIQKHFLKKAQTPKPPVMPNGKPAARNGDRKVLSLDEFHDYLDDLKKKG
jgi:hypothetical protein